MSAGRVFLSVISLLGLVFHPQSAVGMGGQFGLEFAIDAPWRIEPVPVPAGGYTYGAIPIIITFHDAIYDHHREGDPWYVELVQEKYLELEQIHVGSLKSIKVTEHVGVGSPSTVIDLSQLREIERKRWISTREEEPPHEWCHPYLGQNCSALHFISDSHEWHAMFWYAPKLAVAGGRNIHLEVEVVTEHEEKPRYWRNFLVVHAGEAPLPRFSRNWLYGDLHYHSQMTDNAGESAYSYRNVVRALGAMGLDFTFATDHALDNVQATGEMTVYRCGNRDGQACKLTQDPTGLFAYQCPVDNRVPCKKFQGVEAGDLNSVRFLAAKSILYRPGGANEAVARDVSTGGIANFASRGLLPQVFMGEEIDAWPEMSITEWREGAIPYGDGLKYRWPDVHRSGKGKCLASDGLDTCRGLFSVDQLTARWWQFLNCVGYPGVTNVTSCQAQSPDLSIATRWGSMKICLDSKLGLHDASPTPWSSLRTPLEFIKSCVDKESRPYVSPSLRESTNFLVLDEQGVPVDDILDDYLSEGHPIVAGILKWWASAGVANLPSRQHLVYFPYSGNPDGQGWVSGKAGVFGGALRRLDELLSEFSGKGVAFLAHPLDEYFPSGPGPNMPPYSRTGLDKAWASPAILGLQYWNEDDRFKSRSPDPMWVSGSARGKELLYRLPFQSGYPTRIANPPWGWMERDEPYGTSPHVYSKLYHGGYTWDLYLRKGLNPIETRNLSWLPSGEPRKWFMAGGSDGHGDLNFRRAGRPHCGKQWCDSPTVDTAIGKPRNLVLVGSPIGPSTPEFPNVRRHTNGQVIQALSAGRFSITDGPALRIAIDRNRNGMIDDADFQMGGTFHHYPGDHVPLLIEWISTKEFGRMKKIDVYIGTPERTFAPSAPGPQFQICYIYNPAPIVPRALREGELVPDVSTPVPGELAPPSPPGGVTPPPPTPGNVVCNPEPRSATAYEKDPSGALRVTVSGAMPDMGYQGRAKLYLSPAQFDLVRADGRLFYVRAYAETFARMDSTSGCTGRENDPGSCGDRLAFANPIWGRFKSRCNGIDAQGLDGDGNRVPDTCERTLPDPCPPPNIKGGSKLSGVVAPRPGELSVDPTIPRPGVTTGTPLRTCQIISAVPSPPPGVVAPSTDILAPPSTPTVIKPVQPSSGTSSTIMKRSLEESEIPAETEESDVLYIEEAVDPR